MSVMLCEVVDRTLSASAHEAAVSLPETGAAVVFCGTVRDNDHGRVVTELEYEAHPTAAAVLADVARRFAEQPDVLAVAVSHRSGVLAIGELAFVAAVSARHRGVAFDACASLVDEVKRVLPVWKRQVFDDGSDEWVNCP